MDLPLLLPSWTGRLSEERGQHQAVQRRQIGGVGGVLDRQLVVDVRQERVGGKVPIQVIRVLVAGAEASGSEKQCTKDTGTALSPAGLLDQ